MKGIKFITMVVLVTALLTSCGSLRNKSKQSSKHTIEEVVKKDCVTVDLSIRTGEVKEQVIDKGVTVTERETSTTTTKPPTNIKVSAKKEDLKPGNNFLKDSAGNLVNVILDSLGNTLTIDMQIPGETTTKTEKEKITSQNDRTEDRQENTTEQVNKQVAVTNQQERKEVAKQAASESKVNVWAILMNNIGWAIGAAILIFALLWYFGVRRRNTTT